MKWYHNLWTICILLLAGCSSLSGNEVPVVQTTQDIRLDAVDTASHSPQSTLPTSTPQLTPTLASKWDDRSAYLQNLNPYGQQFLESLPQASVYHISLDIPQEMNGLFTGHMEVRYFNQESVALEQVYFRLFPNYYGGQLTVQNVLVDEQPAHTTLEGEQTALRVDLAQPLEPGQNIVFSMEYALRLPEEMGGNHGLLGYFEEILVLDTFYPMIPAYDEDGWYARQPFPNGDLTYNDASFYLVEVSAPANLKLAASGSVIEESIEGERQHLRMAAGPARDFYLAGSQRFSVLSKAINGIEINSYAPPEFRAHQTYALEAAGRALQVFTKLFGPYPYTEFEVVSTPMQALGIEYPGLTGIFWKLYQEDGYTDGVANQVILESVVAHEVAHQWFYNVVGNDQQSEPWLDEAVVQYITRLYWIYSYGEQAGNGLESNWKARWGSVDFEEIPLGLATGDYDGKEYSAIIYGRGPIFLLELQAEMRKDVLLQGLRDYYQQQQWQLSSTEALRLSLEKACGCDLTDLFAQWVYPVE